MPIAASRLIMYSKDPKGNLIEFSSGGNRKFYIGICPLQQKYPPGGVKPGLTSHLIWRHGVPRFVKRKKHSMIAAAAVTLVGLSPFLTARAESGRALDWATHEPISGARMILDCYRNPLLFQLEGTVHLRTVVQVTDRDGQYTFSPLDKLGCAVITFGGEKVGYSGSESGILVEPLQIPALVYLIKTSDRVLFDLQHLVPSTGRTSMQKDGSFVPDPYGEYQDVYQAFYKAKRIATAPREIAFVHEHFCDRLLSLYSRLSDEQRSSLAKYDTPGFSYADKYYRGGSYAGHASEVVPYCAGEDQPPVPPPATAQSPGS